MIYVDSDVHLTTLANGKLDWILDSSSAYHLCENREMFSTYATCDDGLVWKKTNTVSRLLAKEKSYSTWKTRGF